MARFYERLKSILKSIFGSKKTIKLGIYGETNTGKTTLANRISMDWLGEPVGIVSNMPHQTRMIQKKEHVEIKTGGKNLTINLLDMPGLATTIDAKVFLKFKKTVADEESLPRLEDLKLADLKRIAKEKNINAAGPRATVAKVLSEKIDGAEIGEILKKLKIVSSKKKKPRNYNMDEARKIAEEATSGIIEAIRWLDKMDTVLVVMDATKDPLTQVNLMLIGNLEAKKIPILIVANKIDEDKADVARIRNSFPQHPVVGISALKGTNMDVLYQAIADPFTVMSTEQITKGVRKKR